MKKYQIIYADPPWQVKAGPGWSSSGISRDLKYPTMAIEEIKNLPIKDISAKNAHLYLWLINKYIPEGYEIAKVWGFKPITLLTWCKPAHRLGLVGAFVQTTEHLLFCRRGNLKTLKRIDTTWFLNERHRHSEKPQFFRDIIRQVSGDLMKIELFARERTFGWDVWGNEVKSDIELKVAG